MPFFSSCPTPRGRGCYVHWCVWPQATTSPQMIAVKRAQGWPRGSVAKGGGGGGGRGKGEGATDDEPLLPRLMLLRDGWGGGADVENVEEEVLQEGRAWLHSLVKAIETCLMARVRILNHSRASSFLSFLLQLLPASAAAGAQRRRATAAGEECSGGGGGGGGGGGDEDFIRLCWAVLGVKRKRGRKLAADCEEGGAREGMAGAAGAQELDRGLEQLLVRDPALARTLVQALCSVHACGRTGGRAGRGGDEVAYLWRFVIRYAKERGWGLVRGGRGREGGGEGGGGDELNLEAGGEGDDGCGGRGGGRRLVGGGSEGGDLSVSYLMMVAGECKHQNFKPGKDHSQWWGRPKP